MRMRVLAGATALALIAAPGLLLAQDASGIDPQTGTQAPAGGDDAAMPEAPSGTPSPDTAPDAGTIEEAPAGALPDSVTPESSPEGDEAYPVCSRTVKDHCRSPKGQ